MSNSTLNVSDNQQGDVTVIKLAGSIDAATAPRLNEALQKQLGAGRHQLICDMSGVDYISSAGVGTLLAALKETRTGKGKLVLAGVQQPVQDIFDVLRFSPLFVFTASTADALKEFS